jgi:ADP-heptose:LPS heptosyltransferase
MFDFHLPLMSCPHVLGISLQSLAVPLPYLRVCADKARQWRARLGEVGGPLIGLVCSGSRTHREDRHRSIPLEELFSALPIGPRYVLLQADIRSDDRRLLSQRADVLNFADKLTDFDETAALCSLMDAVVSVDTSVAHLAGALNRPVHLLLPFNSDFRWLRHRSDSPWYPSMRLFRQPAMGRWTEPLAEMGATLLAEIKKTLADHLIEYADCEV